MLRTILLPHLAAAIIATVLTGLIYVGVQQAYRMGANDPQLQVARQIAYKLSANRPVTNMAYNDTVNLLQSLGTFIQVYNANQALVTSTGYIGATTPVAPPGVLEAAAHNGENLVTWQPALGVRLACVIEATRQGDYVLVGRSLGEVEKRESNLLTMCILCWLACMGILCSHALLQRWLIRLEKANT